ncbi:hypothetical protein GGR52DRAFT_160384 [Hypoxylon sp. FL1284]|nr:hypothetical protein GGR52DRAFT_160384 [Hypoxylon sp. FL1284]
MPCDPPTPTIPTSPWVRTPRRSGDDRMTGEHPIRGPRPPFEGGAAVSARTLSLMDWAHQFREICLVCLPYTYMACLHGVLYRPSWVALICFSCFLSASCLCLCYFTPLLSPSTLLPASPQLHIVRPVIFLASLARPPWQSIGTGLDQIRGDHVRAGGISILARRFPFSTPLPISAAAVSRQGTRLTPPASLRQELLPSSFLLALEPKSFL